MCAGNSAFFPRGLIGRYEFHVTVKMHNDFSFFGGGVRLSSSRMWRRVVLDGPSPVHFSPYS